MTTDRRDAKEQGENRSGHLGGARADFIASLGRKVEQAREILNGVEARAADPEPREELRRRLHALGVSAKMMHLDVMARTLAEADGLLERVSKAGVIGAADVAELAQVLDDLPALAWGETPKDTSVPKVAAASAAPMQESPASVASFPALTRSCVLFGSEMIAEALTDEAYDGATFECERTEHVQAAIGLARSLAPDVVVVDADVPAALELVETLLDDPLTESVPILVIGTFAASEQAARFVALGVTRTIPKPISPESLRATCDEAIASREGRTVRVSLGEPTLEQLGDRLANEVRQALVDSVDRAGRTVRVPLGEGTEVLGAIWGAIARVREVVTSRTDGAVRFGKGPEGSIALAPVLSSDVARGDRAAARVRGPAADVRLTGRKVVVVDDDPGVTWFIADLLRTAGCQVFEALDGARALELCHQHSPELVVSDILMPGLDGFALCRALKRDLALRDTPVILLSWKEDLLQRVRELGASAAAYLRKESDSRAIVARVREVLRPRARVEARIKSNGEVRGRLDGLTVTSLLTLVCAIRPFSRLSVRDATFLYEVEIRHGAPKRVTRTAGDGGFQRGPSVLTAMLGISAGRFTLADSDATITGDLRGALAEQLAPAIALARGAAHATTGARVVTVERVLFDEAVVEAYLRATPGAARDLIERLAEGASPRAILLGGATDPSLLEDVLSDLAARGAVVGVVGTDGVDMLSPAVERARAVMGSHEPAPSPPVGATRSTRPGAVSDAPKAATPTQTPSNPSRGPSSLADAVMREISHRSPEPGASRPVSSSPPPLVEPANLKPRSNPPTDMVGDVVPEEAPPFKARLTLAEIADQTDVEHTAVEAREMSIPVLVETSQPERVAPIAQAVSEEASEEMDDEHVADPAEKPAIERSERTPLSSVVAESALPVHRTKRWTYVAVAAGAAVIVWAALQTRSVAPPEPVSGHAPTVTNATALPPRAIEPVFVDPPAGAVLAAGEGMLIVAMPEEAPIKVDGVPRGRGPKLALTLKAGSHDVLLGGADRPRSLEVRAGRATKLELPETP